MSREGIERSSGVKFPRKLGSLLMTENYDTNQKAESVLGKIDRNLRKNGWEYQGQVPHSTAGKAKNIKKV